MLNALFARREGGSFVLRFDDTDVERSKREYADAISQDLEWLGIAPDEVVRQSERFALYDEVAQRLRDMGRLYACYETPDELDRRRKRQLARGLPRLRSRGALATDDAKRALEAEGASRTGASCSTTRPSPGRIWCGARAMWTAPRCPIPC